MRLSVAVAAAALLSACATAQKPVVITTAFDPAEIEWFQRPGDNVIRGNAVLRTVGGDAKTCAGLDVHLVPVSTYATERFRAIYGSAEGGLQPARTPVQLSPADPRYEAFRRSTRCDSDGDFVFSGLPDGSYFVTAPVIWGVHNGYFTEKQGGYVMQRVAVAGGERRDVVLTQ